MSLPLLHAGRTNPGLSAALDLRFALDKSLTAYRGPTPSFSRASTGSYFDGSGVLRYAALNLNLYSEQFDNAAYTKNQGAVSANQTTAPDGKITADSFTASAGTVNPHAYQAVTTANGSVYTFSIYVKKNTHDFVQIVLNGVANGFANFDINNGVLGTLGAGGSATSSIVNVGNGWYRCVVSYTTASTSGNGFINLIGSATAGRGATFTAAGTESVYLWGQQLELSSTVGTYCPTTSSANSAPRFNHTFNGTSWVSKGLLLEEQRTNILSNSEDFSSWSLQGTTVTVNSIAAPDGATTADTVYETSTTGEHNRNQLVTSATGTYTASFFVKYVNRQWAAIYIYHPSLTRGHRAWFDIQNGTVGTTAAIGTGLTNVATGITNCGNGWYRIWLTATTAATDLYSYFGCAETNGGSSSYAGNSANGYYVWGAQTELGAFPTSYIPAITGTTRSADVCQITGSDFSGFWNGTEGTIVGDFDRLFIPTGTASALYTARDSANNNAIYYYIDVSNDVSQVYASGASATFDFGSPVGAGISNKIATAYKANDFAASRNSSTPLTDTSGAVPSGQTLMEIGSTVSANYLNGHIARLRYFNKRLPNATLQLLSEPDPTLNLQFALNKTLTPVAGPAPSFSRASTGSYFDSTGTLKYANVNLLTYSEQFDNAAWTKYELTIGQTLYSSPNGSLSARRIIETSNNDLHATWRQIVTTVSGTFTDTIYMKAGERQYGYLQIANNANDRYTVLVDLINGLVVTTSTSGTIANQSNSIESVGNGWYRIRVTASFPNGGTYVQLIAGPSNSSTPTFIYGCPSYAGDTSKGIYIFGAQLENGSSPSQYAKTEASTTAGPRFDHVYSGGQWVSKGLLVEEQRTNICLQSNTFNTTWLTLDGTVTANAALSPDGTNNAWKLNETSANSVSHGIYQPLTIGSGTYTWSVFAKAGERSWLQFLAYSSSTNYFTWFNLANGTVGTNAAGTTASIQDVGGGWYRCSVSRSTSSGTSYAQIYAANADNNGAYAGDSTKGIYIYGCQVEAGAFPTSYTGTTSSSVTRSADVCQITGTSFNWMWNQGEGSFSFEADALNPNSVASGQTVYSFDDGSSANSIYALRSGNTAGSDFLVLSYTGGVEKVNFSNPAGTWLVNVPFKNAIGFKLNDFAQSNNGGSVVTDTNCTMPIGVNQLSIGRLSYAGFPINGHIAKLIYYPARLTNTKLRVLSGSSISSFIPSDVAGLQMWLDASDASTLYQSSGGSPAVADGDPIGEWRDKSGNGKHATQASGTNKPSVRLNIKNGLSVVRMDGVSSRLIESTLSLNAPYSIFGVAKRSGGDVNGRLFHLGASQDQFLYLGTLGSDGYAWFNGNGTTWNSVANTTPSRTWGSGFHFFGGTNSSGTAIPYWDTYTQDSVNGTTAQSTGYAFGYLPTLSSIQRFGGDICEFLIYNKLLTSTEIGNISGYLKSKWGVS